MKYSSGLLLILILSVANSQIQIPKYLRECYTNETLSGPELPMNLQVLIDIIRKAEKYSQMSMDMRTMASSLLHRFKFDGIEYNHNIKLNDGVLPFGGTGSQRIKNHIIEELVPGNANAFPSNALTLFERCALHRAISNTIWEQEMPDRNKYCENRPTEKISGSASINGGKTCPLEQGVILTPFGTIAPGTVIAAISAALQPQNVAVRLLLNITDKYDFNEDEVDFIIPKSQMDLHKSMWFTSIISSTAELDNIWLATVAGELAELTIYQGPLMGPRMNIGATGFWNNTMRPTRYYLEKDLNFDLTRAEVVGAVDGFIIAKNLPSWMSKFNNLRLSQILDMYYSIKGPSFDSRIRACERGKSFWYIASRTTMEEQTYTASQILAYRKSVAHMTDDVLMTMTNHAVNKFTNYVNNNLFAELHCINNKKTNNYPHVEVSVVFDGAWSREYTADFLSVLLEDLNVSMFGSKIGFLHGNNGEWILNITESSSLAHQAIANLTSISWPTNSNFINLFKSIEKYLTQRWYERHENYTIGSLGQVILILAPLVNLNTAEQETIIPSLVSLKNKHPDLNFVYYTTDKNSRSFKQFLNTEEDYLITSSKINDIRDYLLTIPRSLRPRVCQKNTTVNMRDQFEGYIQPQETIVYRLDPRWRIDTKYVSMKIISVGYGTIEVCWWTQLKNNVKKELFACRELSGHNEIIIPDTLRCKKITKCPAIFYQIRGILSLKKCAEMDCKTPDYIRYLMRIEHLECSGGKKFLPNLFNILFIILSFILIKNHLT